MRIIKKDNFLWSCYPTSRDDFNKLKSLCRKQLGKSRWSVFSRTWTIRQIYREELQISSYKRVFDIKCKDTIVLIQLMWG